MTELVAIEQRPGRDDDAPWVMEAGERIPGTDNGRRLAELQRGLRRHPGVRFEPADAGDAGFPVTAERRVMRCQFPLLPGLPKLRSLFLL